MNVGAFSALNGVAGAYAERLPVIFVAYQTGLPLLCPSKQQAPLENQHPA